jgi:hypothetical protein
MGGVGHFKTPKKKPNFGGNTHVALNPKQKQLGIPHKEPGIAPGFLWSNSLEPATS